VHLAHRRLSPRWKYACSETKRLSEYTLTEIQGVNGLTARDIKLVVEGGFNTVESIAYT
jgi:hypothetical protein